MMKTTPTYAGVVRDTQGFQILFFPRGEQHAERLQLSESELLELVRIAFDHFARKGKAAP